MVREQSLLCIYSVRSAVAVLTLLLLACGTMPHVVGTDGADTQHRDAVTPFTSLAEAARLNTELLRLSRAGRYDEAISLAERALRIREKSLRPDHPEVAQSLNNLAVLYRATGDYAKAEPLYQRALGFGSRPLGQTIPMSLNPSTTSPCSIQ